MKTALDMFLAARKLSGSAAPPRSPHCPFTHKDHRKVFVVDGNRYVISCPVCDASPTKAARMLKQVTARARKDMVRYRRLKKHSGSKAAGK